MDEYSKNKIITNQDLLEKNFEKHFITDFKKLTKSNYKSDKYKFSSFITNYLIFTKNDITYDWHYKKKIYYGFFQKELTEYSMYGVNEVAKRYNSEEKINNPHFRSLIISALLRCIYTALSSPYKIVRYNLIEIIINNNLIKDIIIFF